MADEATVDTGAEQETPDGVAAPETSTEGGEKTYTEAAYRALEKENQKYREQYEPYKKVFDNPDNAIFYEAAQARAIGRDDLIQEWLLENTAATYGLTPDVLLERLQDQAEDDGHTEEPLTRSEVQQMLQDLQQSQQQSAQQAEVGRVFEAAKELGYTSGTREAQDLLFIASHETDGDLEKAHEIRSGERDKIIQQYLDDKRSEANGNLRTGNGAQASQAREIKMGDARQVAQEMIDRLG